jgi:hypothetical protein
LLLAEMVRACGRPSNGGVIQQCRTGNFVPRRSRFQRVFNRNLRRRRDLISAEEIKLEINLDVKMTSDQSIGNHSTRIHSARHGGVPLFVAAAVAVLGVVGMLIVDHGPWNKPKVQTAEVAHYSTTGEAARAVGAMVVPTEPKSQLEPDAPGPKPVHPVNPETH